MGELYPKIGFSLANSLIFVFHLQKFPHFALCAACVVRFVEHSATGAPVAFAAKRADHRQCVAGFHVPFVCGPVCACTQGGRIGHLPGGVGEARGRALSLCGPFAYDFAFAGGGKCAFPAGSDGA